MITAPAKTVEAMKNGSPVRIVAIGDSLTQGWLVPKGYVDFVEEMLRDKYANPGISIINRGIPGDTAEGGLLRLRHDVTDLDPDCVFIQFALNDAFMGVPVQVYQNYVQGMIDAIRNDTEADIVLITSVFLDNEREYEQAMKFYSALEFLAEKNSIPVAKVHSYWEKKVQGGTEFRSLVQWDLVHPRVEGYRLMAEAVMELF
ncbi:MAG TPA: GDSL-type esterase/lipase family protein [Spirochaetota bacterium]|nr:GDSL-type esterase/lipase family protein [Spirochaetota bacterium]